MNLELPFTTPRDDDREARRAAQCEFDRPVLLEAGAGTGKTSTLVARVVTWCLGRGWLEAEADGEPSERCGGEGRPAGPPATLPTSTDPGEDADATDRTAARVLQGVVAITFTEAAAAEMSSRVAATLAAFAAGSERQLRGFDLEALPATDADPARAAASRRRRARALLGALDHLTVRTIHAFCRGLLAAYPLEARIHPQLRVDADGRILEEVTREVVEEAVRQAYAEPEPGPLVQLAVAGLGPQALADAVRALAERGFPAAALAHDPFDEAAVGGLRDRLAEALGSFRRVAGDRLLAVSRGTLAPAVARAVEISLQATRAAGSTVEDLEALRLVLEPHWPDSRLRRLGDWGRGRLRSAAEEEALGGMRDELAAAAAPAHDLLRHLTRLRPLQFGLARRALEPLLGGVESELRARGVATFAALLAEARGLLSRNKMVAARERRRIRQLLVDEFQDTDRLQCDLVRILALEGRPEDRPSLFVVGDPKQSIYGWRDADLAAYAGFLDEAVAAGGRIHTLSRNFRSRREILDEVERVVRPVMQFEAGLQPCFEPLTPTVGDDGPVAPDRAPVEYWIAPADSPGGADDSGGEAAARLEARAVAADLVQLHRSGVAWREAGVLFRSTNRQELFLEAFREAGVPFVVTRDKHYFRRREVIEAAALVRTVIHPADHLALVTFLRSATVGVPDAALLPLWSAGLPRAATELATPAGGSPAARAAAEAADRRALAALARLVDGAAKAVPTSIPGLERVKGWPESLKAALQALARLRRAYERDAADVFLGELRRRLLPEATEAARFLGRFRVANLERFFRRLETALDESGGDVQAILRSLRRGVAEAQESEEALPRDAAQDAVQVLTIHRAKGLEFGHVYIVQLHATTREESDARIDLDERWSAEGPWEYSLFGSPTPSFYRVERRRRQVTAAERVRTLYVAMTRAERRVVLAGQWPDRPARRPVERARSYLDLVAHRAELPESVKAIGEAIAGPGDEAGRGARRQWLDICQARWRLLGEAPATVAAGRGEATPRHAARARIERAAALLRDRWTRAAQRMQRPFAEAASAAAAERLDELLAGREAAGYDALTEVGRDVAKLVGREIHRTLEHWPAAAEGLAQEIERQRGRLLDRVEAVAPAPLRAPAVARADRVFERLATGSLLPRLVALAPAVLARELPFALPPIDGTDRDDGAVGFVSGVVDLVYRDPESGQPVIVDFKTDEVGSEEELAERAAAYAPQEQVYREALRQALELAEPPRCELWFLWADRVWSSP